MVSRVLTAKLYDTDVRLSTTTIIYNRLLRDGSDSLHDFVGDVGDDLHSLPKVLPSPFLGNHLLVDLPGGQVRVGTQLHIQEPLVIAQIQVRFPSVIEDEDFSMLERTHRTGIDIQVGVDLYRGGTKMEYLHQDTDARGRDPLTDPTDHSSSDDDELLLREVGL